MAKRVKVAWLFQLKELSFPAVAKELKTNDLPTDKLLNITCPCGLQIRTDAAMPIYAYCNTSILSLQSRPPCRMEWQSVTLNFLPFQRLCNE